MPPNRRARRSAAAYDKAHPKPKQSKARLDANVTLFPRAGIVPWARPKQAKYSVSGDNDVALLLGLVSGAMEVLGYRTKETQAALIGEAVNQMEEPFRRIAARVIAEGVSLTYETETVKEGDEEVKLVRPKAVHGAYPPLAGTSKENSPLWTPSTPIR